MRCAGMILLLQGFGFSIFAQADSFYVNALGTKVPKELATFIRVIPLQDTLPLKVIDFYTNGRMACSGYFTNRMANVRQGECLVFDTTGSMIQKGNYKQGRKDGEWVEYSASGKKKEIRQYNASLKTYFIMVYDTLTSRKIAEGFLDENGKKHGCWKEYHTYSDTVKWIKNFAHGIRQGKQEEFYRSGQCKRIEYYNGSSCTQKVMYDENGNEVKYYPAFEYAVPPESVSRYLRKRVKCLQDIQQKIDIRIRVDNTGNTNKTEVLGLPNNDCCNAITKALLTMKKWKPAKEEGEPIYSTFQITLHPYTPRE